MSTLVDYDLTIGSDIQPDEPQVELELLRNENRALRQKVQSLEVFKAIAYRDPLTELYNRRYFEEHLFQEISRARRTGRGFALLVMDINDFKKINDLKGHILGDEVLKYVARSLETNLRTEDICCRLGGDEFVAILPNTDTIGATFVAQRLRTYLLKNEHEKFPPISLAFGVAFWNDQIGSTEELIALADEAMYRDKRLNKSSSHTGGRLPMDNFAATGFLPTHPNDRGETK